MNIQKIADTLKELREKRGLSQSELAKLTGIKQQRISYYENAKHIPSIMDCIILADYYDITLDDLVGREFK